MGKGRQALGKWGEEKACEYITRIGYRVLEANYRCYVGEVDLIAEHGGTIVFIEVKTRRTTDYGAPAEAVNYRKQEKYFKLAVCYINEKHLADSSCRFDIIEILAPPHGEAIINHIPNAFQVRNGSYSR